MVLINKDFYDFISLFSSLSFVFKRRYIKHLRDCFITFLKTSKFVKKYSAARCICDPLLGIWKCDETLSIVFDAYRRDSVSSGYPNTEKRVENTMHSGVFFDKMQGVG